MTIEIEGNDCNESNESNGCYNPTWYELDYSVNVQGEATPVDQKAYNRVVQQMTDELYFIGCHNVTQPYRPRAKCNRAAIVEIHYQVHCEIVKRLYRNINVEHNRALANL